MLSPQDPYTTWISDMARRYCADSGLSLDLAFRVLTALEVGVSEDLTRLPEEEHAACRQSYLEAEELTRWVGDVWQHYSPTPAAKARRESGLMYPPPDFLPKEDRQAIWAYIERTASHEETAGPGASTWTEVRALSPTCAAHWQAFTAYRQRVEVRGDELRASLEQLVLTETGAVWVHPETWLAQQNISGASLGDLHLGCWWLTREELDDLRQRTETAEQQARADRAALEQERQRSKDLRAGLSDRVILPGQLVRSGYDVLAFKNDVRAIDQRELFPDDDITAPLLRAGAEAVVEQSQLAALSATEIKALVGVYRLFTTQGDDGRELLGTFLPVPARLAYQAAGVKSTRDKSRRAMFEAFRLASARTLYVSLRGETDDGKPYVVGDRVSLFNMRPVWTASADKRRSLTASDADHLAREWAQLTSGSPWHERLPDGYVFTLPPIMRKIWHRLVVSADILDRLDQGAKTIRGGSEGFTRLDWRLYIAATQTVQHMHRTADGSRFLSFVNPHAILCDVYGEEKVERARKRGKKTYIAQYDKAVAVLVGGGIAACIERDYRTADGELRDVLALDPTVMVSHTSRLKQSPRRKLLTAPKTPKKPRNRRRDGGTN